MSRQLYLAFDFDEPGLPDPAERSEAIGVKLRLIPIGGRLLVVSTGDEEKRLPAAINAGVVLQRILYSGTAADADRCGDPVGGFRLFHPAGRRGFTEVKNA